MTTHPSSRFSLLKSILLFMGAAAFAWCFCAVAHEGGHYIAYNALGIIPRTGISLHPFGDNYNISLNEDGTFWQGSPEVENAGLIWAIMGGSGPVLNLLICLPIGLLFWKKRSPALLPLLMTGGLALLMEGWPMLEQAFGFGGDWYQVIYWGVPLILVSLIGAVVFASGFIWILQLLPLAGISAQDPFWRRLVVLLAGLPLFISGTVFYQLLFGVDRFIPSWNRISTVSVIVIQHLIELGVAIIIMTAIAALYRPLSSWLDRLSHTPIAQVRWRAVLVSIGLAVVIIAVQLVFFNDPTAQILG